MWRVGSETIAGVANAVLFLNAMKEMQTHNDDNDGESRTFYVSLTFKA